MIALLGLLVTWWPVLALLYVPRLATSLSAVIARRVKTRLDHQIPDELPMTAGEWLAGRLTELRDRGHPISQVVTDQHPDAYDPRHKVIQLTAETHFKSDPVYWSTAAHELGHARIRADWPILGILRRIASWAGVVLVAAGTGLALGRVLYALPIAGALAVRCFAVAAGLQVFVLLDEGLASVLAYRELRASDAIDFVHLRAVRRSLLAAFATYLATYAAYALLLRYWPLVEALAGAHPARPGGLTHLGWAAAALATAGCVGTIMSRLVWMLAPRDLTEALDERRTASIVLGVLRAGSIVVLVWLAWDHRVDAAYAWCAILAFAASAAAWRFLAHLPLLIPHALIELWLTRFAGPGVENTARYLRARRDGLVQIVLGNRRLARIADRYREDPPWLYRLAALTKLGYLPLVIAFWLR